MVSFKETIRRNPYRGENIYNEIKKILRTFFWFAKNFFYLLEYLDDNFVIEYLDEIETEFENTSNKKTFISILSVFQRQRAPCQGELHIMILLPLIYSMSLILLAEIRPYMYYVLPNGGVINLVNPIYPSSGYIIISMDPDPDQNLAHFHHLSPPSSHLIFHPSSLTQTPSSLTPHPRPLLLHPTSLIHHPSPPTP